MKNNKASHVSNIDFMSTSHQTFHHDNQQTVTLLGLMCRIYATTILHLHSILSTNVPALNGEIKKKIPCEMGGRSLLFIVNFPKRNFVTVSSLHWSHILRYFNILNLLRRGPHFLYFFGNHEVK